MLRNCISNLSLNHFLSNNQIGSLIRNIAISHVKYREVTDRKEMLKSVPTLDEGTAGEKSIDVDSLVQQYL